MPGQVIARGSLPGLGGKSPCYKATHPISLLNTGITLTEVVPLLCTYVLQVPDHVDLKLHRDPSYPVIAAGSRWQKPNFFTQLPTKYLHKDSYKRRVVSRAPEASQDSST